MAECAVTEAWAASFCLGCDKHLLGQHHYCSRDCYLQDKEAHSSRLQKLAELRSPMPKLLHPRMPQAKQAAATTKRPSGEASPTQQRLETGNDLPHRQTTRIYAKLFESILATDIRAEAQVPHL
ncbi:uncharacterized protein UV8b_05911 [Ustilaginoidea virens]|uniref:Uncharacterized protein n=1 Tax=Ustilaginoidea virens TaxID=1159556 RepID=A0A063BPL6_USTVR|nr:uncharacterized protein UV8b_05911 [Ustilaginoidea virens]QUC21668.1 hypothetical protein UV8b_05911 [Ustilaginoidea virens]GAO18800.1 hypothetical protein UVI_02015080 [Ustilaginoidea virens]